MPHAHRVKSPSLTMSHQGLSIIRHLDPLHLAGRRSIDNRSAPQCAAFLDFRTHRAGYWRSLGGKLPAVDNSSFGFREEGVLYGRHRTERAAFRMQALKLPDRDHVSGAAWLPRASASAIDLQ